MSGEDGKLFPEDVVEDSFFHEVAHAILGEWCWGDEYENEQLVECLSKNIKHLIKNNKFEL